jgi:hypothetical protein
VFDLPYILTHPLLAAIYRRHAELVEEAKGLPAGSPGRVSLEKRISRLEQYRPPRPSTSEQQVTAITNELGQVVGERSSLRLRFRAVRPGRPEEHRIKVRAAFEDKTANPSLTWRNLADQYGFNNPKDLERHARMLRALLKREGISLPLPSAYQDLRVLGVPRNN